MRKWMASLIVLWTMVTSAPGLAQNAARRAPPPSALAEYGLEEVRVSIGGRERWLLVVAPSDRTRPAPVILLLHGGGQSMRKIFGPHAGPWKAWPALARAKNALLLVPNGTHPETGDAGGEQQQWNDLRVATGRMAGSAVDDVAFLTGLLRWAAESYAIDTKRVLVTGASNGGMMTMRLLVEAPESFSAGAAFLAALPVTMQPLPKPARPTPLLLMNGTDDPLVPWAGGQVARNRGVVRSTPDTLAWWIAANRASKAATMTDVLPPAQPADGCRIERAVHAPEAGGAVLEMLTMHGGGHVPPSKAHAIPNGPIISRLLGRQCRGVEAAELVWEWFERLPAR